MNRKKGFNPGPLAAINEGVEKARRRNAGKFDGMYGTLPEGVSVLLDDIIAYLREYLLDERGYTETTVRDLLVENLPRKGFRSVSQES